MAKKTKTNACRKLDQSKISYQIHEYYESSAVSGKDVANFLKEDPDDVYKTLVVQGKSKNHYVFVIPVLQELDLKKAAKAAGEKSVLMLAQKDLLPLTGYEHGGCSPIGMKKEFSTFIDQKAQEKDRFFISGGRIGLQLELSPRDLRKIVPYTFSDLTKDKKTLADKEKAEP